VLLPEGALLEAVIKPDDGIVTTPLEMEVFNYTKRRLAFLIKEDTLFEEIDKIEYRDYEGKFVVFYKKERAGRLFELYEGGPKKYRFDFGETNGGEVLTSKLSEIDSALGAIFRKRVLELEGAGRRAKAA
jgi:hypothetical protein